MPFFDNSTAVPIKHHSPKRIYHSYMCPSRCEYMIKNTEDPNTVDKPTWINPETSLTHDKRLQMNISKLRDILSDTIASLTKENNLKKGESVELTLEIELMKSIENTPATSLVEVTIIQHNSKKKSNSRTDKISNKMLFKIEKDNLLVSEPSMERRQSWFKRVTSRENTVCNQSKELRKKSVEHKVNAVNRKLHKPLFCPTANQRFKELNNSELQDLRKKFVNILPEETTQNENEIRKTTKRENRLGKGDEICSKSGFTEKVNKKSSLMKKISEVFLPQKKPSKEKLVESALTTFKNEINSMKVAKDESEKYRTSKKQEKSQVQNLGKIVNNILFDVVASMDGDEKDKIKEELKLPLQYHSFFEPVTKSKKKNKKLKRRNTSPSLQRLYRSHSDTCCVSLMKNETIGVKSSHSIGDCSSNTLTKTPPEVVCVGDTRQKHKKRRRSHTRDYSRNRKKSLKSDKRMQSKTLLEEPNNIVPQQNVRFSKSSLIQWNGRCVKVSKDIKTRIELLIVNELENLALKEGMECDVTPLSSTDETIKDTNTVEKVSSFVCELDISDKNVKKVMKRKKSLTRKVSVHRSTMETIKPEKNMAHKGRTNTTLASSGTQTLPILRKHESMKNSSNSNDSSINKSEVNPPQLMKNERNPVLCPAGVKQDSVEITFMNKNMQNWSAESQSITIYGPEVVKSSQQHIVCDCISRSKSKKSNRFISTGFVKIIRSDDSTWNNGFPQTSFLHCDRIQMYDSPGTNINTTTGPLSTLTGKSTSKTSSDLESSIEIELDIQDLEYILKEAKQNNNANKVLIEAKSVNPCKKQKSSKPVAKNSPSYTNQLLTKAAKKLEKYTDKKTRHKRSKY